MAPLPFLPDFIIPWKNIKLTRNFTRLAASSIDTPLKTVQALQEAQQKTGSAYVVLQAGSHSIAARQAEAGEASSSKRKGNNPPAAGKRAKS